jgi:hypothetical protein
MLLHLYPKELQRIDFKSKARLVALWIIISIILLCGVSCTNKVSQASRDLAANITRAQSTQPETRSPDTAIEEKRVYLDASISMKGFVNPAQHSQFDDFIDAIGDALPGCQIYKYGQKGSTNLTQNNSNLTERTNFGLELHRPDFYSLAYNPDDRLVEQLVAEDHPVLSVLVTDGVYSEPQGSTAPPVVDAMQKWMSSGRVLGILFLKSAFEGPFYSERGRTILQKTTIKARPFYAFVFSPTVKAFRELQEKLIKRFPDMRTLLFSDEAVSCSPKLNEHLKGTYSFKMPPETAFHWQMFDSGLFSQGNPAPVGYNIKCTISPDYPASELKFDLIAEYYRWDGRQFKKVESGPPQGFKYDLNTNEEKQDANNQQQGPKRASNAPPPDVIVYFPKDSGGDYGFYYLKLIASPKSLHPEIQEASTRDDRLSQNSEKTFRFFELIDSLTNVHFKTRLASKTSVAAFITIDNH